MSAKVALVTGGTRGLGRSISRHLARSGVNVIITYRDENLANDAIGEITAICIKGDKLSLDVTDFGMYSQFATARFRAVSSRLSGQQRRSWFLRPV
jgi:NAD(P)-dependent dehydrogenase (short-subunit alcohol dehydrogenase family)